MVRCARMTKERERERNSAELSSDFLKIMCRIVGNCDLMDNALEKTSFLRL